MGKTVDGTMSFQEYVNKTKNGTQETENKKEKQKEPRDLIRNVYKTTRTLELMDEFEGYSKNNSEPYDRLIINGYTGYTKLGNITCQYIIKRMSYKDKVVGNVTFTNLKNGKCDDLKKYITEQIESKIKSLAYDERIEIELDTPYLLRAQYSRNREGYGWEWDWSYGVGTYTEGTEYGETTKYGIVGVRVSKHF